MTLITDNRDDDLLLEAWRAGDRRSGDKLIERHYTKLVLFFRRFVYDPSVGADLAHEVLMRLVQAGPKFGSTRGYIYGVARHVLVDHFRRQSRRPIADGDDSYDVADPAFDPEQTYALNEQAELVKRALHRLPIAQQVVLNMYYWDEMSGSEMSTVLGVSEGTVRGRLRLGMQALKKAIAEVAASPITSHDVFDRAVPDEEKALPVGETSPPRHGQEYEV